MINTFDYSPDPERISFPAGWTAPAGNVSRVEGSPAVLPGGRRGRHHSVGRPRAHSPRWRGINYAEAL